MPINEQAVKEKEVWLKQLQISTFVFIARKFCKAMSCVYSASPFSICSSQYDGGNTYIRESIFISYWRSRYDFKYMLFNGNPVHQFQTYSKRHIANASQLECFKLQLTHNQYF